MTDALAYNSLRQTKYYAIVGIDKDVTEAAPVDIEVMSRILSLLEE